MIPPLYMLSMFMASWFFWFSHYPTFIIIQCVWLIHVWKNFQIYQEHAKMYAFFCCFTSDKIFNLYYGISYTNLLHALPDYGSSIEDKHWPKYWFPIIVLFLKVRICVFYVDQISTLINQHIIHHSPNILKDAF